MDSNFDFGWILGILFVVLTMIYIAVTIIAPELVGITGTKAKEILKEQQGDTVPQDLSDQSKEKNPSTTVPTQEESSKS